MSRAEEKNQRRNRIIDAAVFAVLLAVVSAVTLYLFYGQTQWDVDSDMEAYILEMQGLESGYSFPYLYFSSWRLWFTCLRLRPCPWP